MKKLLAVMILTCILAFSGMAFAADTADNPAPAASDGITFPGLNLQGDTGYIFSQGKLAFGFGTDLAQWKSGLITLRGETLATDDGTTFAGIGPMINIPKLVSAAGGGEWTNKIFNPSIGVVGGYDFKGGKFDGAVILSIVKVTF